MQIHSAASGGYLTPRERKSVTITLLLVVQPLATHREWDSSRALEAWLLQVTFPVQLEMR